MRYVGGKSKIAKQLTEVMTALTANRETYLEPFVGGGSVLARMAPHFRQALAGDAHEDLILMWQAVQDGWVPPAVTYERYQQLRYSEEPSAERGFAGFGGSFGGRWFEGFARGGFNGDVPRNHQAESSRAVMKITEALAEANVFFQHRDYRSWPTECGGKHVIYCDPPYAGSAHDYKTGVFDTDEFWAQASAWVDEGHDVFVSEYAAPDGWVSVWSAQKRQSLIVGSSERELRTEHLWVRASTNLAEGAQQHG